MVNLCVKAYIALLLIFTEITHGVVQGTNYSVKKVNDKTVRILELSVPSHPKVGEDVTLTCRFELEGALHRLYTVNWWRGQDQFYTYKQNNFQPKNAYTFKGIKVKVPESTASTVVLENVGEETSGLFKCEVMGEGPAFKTAVEFRAMKVIVPPERVEISHAAGRSSLYEYQPEDRIQLNCTAHRVKPRPHLIWRVNGREVSPSDTQRYADFEDHQGRVTSTLGLNIIIAPRYFVHRTATVTCEALVEGHKFTQEEDIHLDPSAAFPHFSSGNLIQSVAWKGSCLVMILVRIWNV